MAFEKIIVLDDELVIRKTLEAQLRKRRYTVATASNLAEAEAYLTKDEFDLMFVDVNLPDGKGTELLERFADNPDAPMVVIITGEGSIESAVECMQKGAFDYIVKPCSVEQIDVVLKKAESFNQLVKVNQYFSDEKATSGGDLVGNSGPMLHLKQMVKKVAATGATVLITGENGTGKELVARELWRQSPLAGQPYIRVNCAAISENLIESEFFGHEKGAFTGATQRREGRFELAHNGTILLDEIGEISPQVQAKLLRVLQEQEFERVGGNKTIRVNVRVLATTNRNLLKAVESGDFREDLYYRLNVFPIVTPPLRDRREDVLLLADHFLKTLSRRHGVELKGFAPNAREALMQHNWPGNVRELHNTVERSVILAEAGSLVPLEALGLPVSSASATAQGQAPESSSALTENSSAPDVAITSQEDNFLSLDLLERDHIFRALARTGGRRNEAAELLNITSRTLRNKLNQYRDSGCSIPGA